MSAGEVCSISGCTRPRSSRGWCNTHYERWRRNGDLIVRTTDAPDGTRRIIKQNGYFRIKAAGHPLAWGGSAQDWLLEHRQVLYEAIGPGEHPCHWCGARIEWDGSGKRELLADHVNGVRADNRPENLVPACRRCNSTRRPPRVCQLLGCGASLDGMRWGARYCCPSHGAMGRRGESLKQPGTCAGCGAPLLSARRKWCGETCRRNAWEAARARKQPRSGHLNGLLRLRNAPDPENGAVDAPDAPALCGCESCLPVERGSGWICEHTGQPTAAPFEVPA